MQRSFENDKKNIAGTYDKFGAMYDAASNRNWGRFADEFNYSPTDSVRQVIYDRAFPQPTAFETKLDMMTSNPIGASFYGISKILGASEATANSFGAFGSGLELLGGAYTGGGMLRKQNISFVTNNGQFNIDELGRLDFMSIGKLTRNPNQGRNISAQLSAGGEYRLAADQGGHYLARLFDGPLFKFNYFAQDANFNMGAYRTFEKYLGDQQLLGKQVSLQIKPSYLGVSERPSSLFVRYSIDGKIDTINFLNRPGGK